VSGLATTMKEHTMKGQSTIAITIITLLLGGSLRAQERPADAELWRTYAERLAPNAFVRGRLTNGKSVRGHVLAVGDGGIRSSPRAGVAVPPRHLPYAEIISIDPQREPRWTPAVKVLMGVGIGAGSIMMLSWIALLSATD